MRSLLSLFLLTLTPCLLIAQQRDDNRRLIWTGSAGMDWDGSSASWQTSGSYLAYANSNSTSAIWLSATTLPSTPFLAGDTAIFDTTSDIDSGAGNPAATRTINIAPGGVTASELILSGAGSYVFTGGAITTDAGAVAPGSVQLSGTGTGMAATNVQPAGRLVKLNTGDLTLANTTPNTFTGGIHIAAGSLTIADKNALGASNITLHLASAAATGAIQLPATVTNASGSLLRDGTALISPVTLRVPLSADGLDITGDIFLRNQTLTLDIEGDTTISGRLYGNSTYSGASAGAIVKTGPGTLTLTGTNNSFFGVSRIEEGRLIAKSSYAIGIGVMNITPGATLEFQNVRGTMRQAFIGGGDIEITAASDITFNWRLGVLDDYESLPAAATQPASNVINKLTVTGASRFTAVATGTSTSVLGGNSAQVIIRDASTLVLAREGISSRGEQLPMSFPILAMSVTITGSSTLLLNPNAFLDIGTFNLSPDSTIAFGASGVSQLRYLAGAAPETFQSQYLLPPGMKLIAINELPVAAGYHREYVVVNQGANPLKDIAMTINALDAAHDTLFARLAHDFIDPVAPRAPARNRKWTNNAWMRYITSQIDYDNTSITTPGVKGRISGGVIGLDGILPAEYLVGIHVGAMENNLTTTNDTSLATKQRFLGVHAAQRFGKIYIAAALDTGRVRTDSIRREPASIVRGKWDTSYYTGSIEAGATFAPWKKTTLKPYAGLRYTNLKISNFYERGPSPLLIDNFTDTAAQATYGLSAGRKFTLLKRDLALDLTLARKHTVKSPRATLRTHYLDSPDTPVTLERGDYYSNITAAGLSLRANLTPLAYAALACDYETSSAHTRFAVIAMAGCKW